MKIGKRAIALLFSFVILALLVLYANPSRFAALLSKSNYEYILIAFVISTITLLLRVVKWQILLENVSFRKILPVQLLGFTLSNFSPGKIAEPVKAIVLKAREGLPVSGTLPSIIWERILDIAVLVVLAISGGYFLVLANGHFFLISVAVIIVFLLFLAVGLLVLYRRSFAKKFFFVVKKLPVANRISDNFIQSFMKSRVKNSRLVLAFAITSAAWLLEGVILYFAFLSIGISLSPIVLACLFALATLIGVASALPGGIGSTDVVMSLFLSYFGVEPSTAIAGVLLARFISLWYSNLLGGISFVYLMKKMKVSYKSILG